MPLDDDFIKDTTFRLNRGEQIMLRPDLKAWDALLVQQERSASYWGCSILLMSLAALVFLARQTTIPSFLILFVMLAIFLYQRARQIYRTRHLRKHGQYSYELKKDRIVRYSDTHYDIFHYHEVDNMVEERYGLRIERGVAWYEWIWPRIFKAPGKRLLILPAYFREYPGYLKFLKAD